MKLIWSFTKLLLLGNKVRYFLYSIFKNTLYLHVIPILHWKINLKKIFLTFCNAPKMKHWSGCATSMEFIRLRVTFRSSLVILTRIYWIVIYLTDLLCNECLSNRCNHCLSIHVSIRGVSRSYQNHNQNHDRDSCSNSSMELNVFPRLPIQKLQTRRTNEGMNIQLCF